MSIPEDKNRLAIIPHRGQAPDLARTVESLRKDLVVLSTGLSAEGADAFVRDIAERFDLLQSLELQAGFASIAGHRANVSEYYMTVNARTDYQFIPAHSEGTSNTQFQLTSFYCHENSTDGGDTILLHVDNEGDALARLREVVLRGRAPTRALSPGERAAVRAFHEIKLPEDLLRDDDEILKEYRSPHAELQVVEVLAAPKKVRSTILDRDLYAYWDSVASCDHESGEEYLQLLRQCGLLKEPPGGVSLEQLDYAAPRRVWRSGVKYNQIFRSRLVRKLQPGELVVFNNLTWAHSASNWSPGSGIRNVTAAFA